MAKNLVIIPTYNERENIERMVRTVLALPVAFDLLVVDDGSPDGTSDIVRSLQAEFHDRLHLMVRMEKAGLGTAYLRGFEWGLENSYRYLFEMDCDFSHNPEDLLRLQRTLPEKYKDVVVGSRYVPGGKLINWPAGRIFISRGASLYVKMLTGMPIKDPTSGFVGYHRKVLENIDFEKIRFVGYAFQIEMKFAAWQLGYNIQEIPITFTDRIEGKSKMSGSIVKEAIWGVVQMRWFGFFGSYGIPSPIRRMRQSTSNGREKKDEEKHQLV